jgi:hypothetical protein
MCDEKLVCIERFCKMISIMTCLIRYTHGSVDDFVIYVKHSCE